MKNLITLLLFIAPLYCLAQTDTLKYKQKEEFCEVQALRVLGGKFTMMTDNGHEKSGGPTWLKDADGSNKKFNSIVSILNYMAQHGWVLVTSFTNVSQGSSDGTHLLYKREL